MFILLLYWFYNFSNYTPFKMLRPGHSISRTFSTVRAPKPILSETKNGEFPWRAEHCEFSAERSTSSSIFRTQNSVFSFRKRFWSEKDPRQTHNEKSSGLRSFADGFLIPKTVLIYCMVLQFAGESARVETNEPRHRRKQRSYESGVARFRLQTSQQ